MDAFFHFFLVEIFLFLKKKIKKKKKSLGTKHESSFTRSHIRIDLDFL